MTQKPVSMELKSERYFCSPSRNACAASFCAVMSTATPCTWVTAPVTAS